MMLVSCQQNPFMQSWNTPYGIPPFDEIEVCHYLPAVKEGIARHNAEIDAIVDNPEEPSFENTISALEYSGHLLSKVTGVFFNICESDGTPEVQELEEKILPMVTAHEDEIMLNKGLFKRVKAVYDGRDTAKLNPEQYRVLEKIYTRFIRSGIALPEAQQEEMKTINARLSELVLRFGQNLLSESNAFKETFGISVSQYSQEMSVCKDRDRREKMFKAYSSRGARGNEADNDAIVLEIMQLRQRQAALLGFESPAAFVLADKMAKNTATVDSFLGGIMPAALRGAEKERDLLQAEMDKDVQDGKLPQGSKLEAWDWFYYAARVRKSNYDLDEAALMPYFKMENVRAGVFGNATRLYDIYFEPLEWVPLYNPEASAFVLRNQSDSTLLGVIITDYFPRATKRAGAWMNDFVSECVLPNGKPRRPVVVNVGNFARPNLTLDDVQTAFHEFGHALHSLFSQCTYPSLAGTNVKRDFVELPSQINENWAFEKEVLQTYAFHCETGEVIPDELIDKIQAASLFNQGFKTTELTAAALLDMAWHELSSMEAFCAVVGPEALSLAGLEGATTLDAATLTTQQACTLVQAFEEKVCEQMGLIGEIIPRYRSTYFNHIFGSSGYQAGYYNYLWAEVLDKDAFSVFEKFGIFDKATAGSFRSNILEKGDSEDPMMLFRRFRGSDPDPDALLRARGLK